MEDKFAKINLNVDLPMENYFSPELLNLEASQESGEVGQLSADVAETESEIIVLCPMAGTLPKSLELHLHNDLLTIKGERFSPVPTNAYYHHKECYFGKFSRSIVLPTDVHFESAAAEYKNGLLVVRLPKTKTDLKIPVYIVEE